MSPRPARCDWLAPGPDRCVACSEAFHVELGVFCAACDGPVCRLCLVWRDLARAPACPACDAEAGA